MSDANGRRDVEEGEDAIAARRATAESSTTS